MSDSLFHRASSRAYLTIVVQCYYWTIDVAILHLFESPWLLCVVTVRALHVSVPLNTMNYSTVVDQSDYSISTMLYYYVVYYMYMYM